MTNFTLIGKRRYNEKSKLHYQEDKQSLRYTLALIVVTPLLLFTGEEGLGKKQSKKKQRH